MIKNLHLGMLVTLALAMSSCTIEESTQHIRAKADAENLSIAIERFRADVGVMPSAKNGLAALERGEGIPGWRGPYFSGKLSDPWGRPYVYRSPSVLATRAFDVYSVGANGKDEECRGDDICNGRDPSWIEYGFKPAWKTYLFTLIVLVLFVAFYLSARKKRAVLKGG